MVLTTVQRRGMAGYSYPALALAMLVAMIGALSPLGKAPRTAAQVEQQVFSGAYCEGSPVPSFTFFYPHTTRPLARGSGRLGPPGYSRHLWGAESIARGQPGPIRSSRFSLQQSFLYVPIAGYPGEGKNELKLIVDSPDGRNLAVVYCRIPAPGTGLGIWQIDIRGWRGCSAVLELTADPLRADRALDVGCPITAKVSGRRPQAPPRGTDYGRVVLNVLAMLTLIFLPGIALAEFFPAAVALDAPWLAVPGMLLLAAYGFCLWLSRTGGGPLGQYVLGGYAALALWIWLRAGRVKPPAPAKGRTGLFYLVAIALALSYSFIKAPVAQEFFSESTFHSRMVASPPDSAIPYQSGSYFYAGHRGRAASDAYFTADWSITSRGPLVPLMIAAGFNLFDAHPSDPPDHLDGPWPGTGDGYYIARAIGIATNALVIFAALELLGALTPEVTRQRWFLAAWLCVAPLTVINIPFLWPKLLASYFVILAVTASIRGSSAPAKGLWCALAYLSHPVGGLMLPAVGLFDLRLAYGRSAVNRWQRCGNALGSGASLVAAVLVVLAPWLLYKHWLGHPDVFAKYPLGDGRGFLAAASFSSWLTTRWSNLWYTFVPLAFFFSHNMEVWLWGPLSGPLRWTVQYAKTLPAHLGFSLCWLFGAATFAVFSRGRAAAGPGRAFFLWFLLPAAISMLLFWGYSPDGLGRNCLEPLSVCALVFGATAAPRSRRWSALGLLLTAGESMFLLIAGIVDAPGYDSLQLTAPDQILLGGLVIGLVAPIVAFWSLSSDRPTGPPIPTDRRA